MALPSAVVLHRKRQYFSFKAAGAYPVVGVGWCRCRPGRRRPSISHVPSGISLASDRSTWMRVQSPAAAASRLSVSDRLVSVRWAVLPPRDVRRRSCADSGPRLRSDDPAAKRTFQKDHGASRINQTRFAPVFAGRRRPEGCKLFEGRATLAIRRPAERRQEPPRAGGCSERLTEARAHGWRPPSLRPAGQV
jgi:hypothetical protein